MSRWLSVNGMSFCTWNVATVSDFITKICNLMTQTIQAQTKHTSFAVPGQSGTTYTYPCPLTEKIVNFQIYRILRKNLVKKATLKLVEFGLVVKKRTLAFRKCQGCYLQFCTRKKLWSVLKIWWLKWSFYIQSETFKGLIRRSKIAMFGPIFWKMEHGDPQ